jgi:hypothetical protein
MKKPQLNPMNKFRKGQRVAVNFREGDADENWTGIGRFERHVKPNEPGLDYIDEPCAIVKTSPEDWGSLFPLRCISKPIK